MANPARPNLPNILIVSSDETLSEPGGWGEKFLSALGENLEEVHSIVFSRPSAGKARRLGEKIWIYPTRSWLRIFRLFDAIRTAFFQVTWRFHFRAQIVYANEPIWAGLAGYFIALRKRRPLAVRVSEDIFSPSYRFSSINRFIRSYVGAFVVTHANQIHAGSEWLKKTLTDRFPGISENIIVVPRFIDMETLANSPRNVPAASFFKDPGFIIAMSGVFLAHKRLSRAVNIVERLSRRYPRTSLLLLGEGPEASRARRRMRRAGLGERIAIVPKNENFHSLLATSHLYLVTSSFEDSDAGILDALAMSTPVVSTDTGMAREILGGTKYERYICSAGNSECLFTATLELVEHLGVRDEYRINAKDIVSRRPMPTMGEYSKNVAEALQNLAKDTK